MNESPSTNPTPPAAAHSAERLVVYSDAVIAIAATLLAIELRVPGLEEVRRAGLGRALLSEWPRYAGFALSFAIITVVWVNHGLMFRHIRKTDHALIAYNTLLLFNIAAIPFCAALLGDYLAQGGSEATLAAMVYGGWICLGGIPFNLIWWHALRNPALLDPQANLEELRRVGRHFLLGPFLYLGCTLLALIHPLLSLGGFLALLLLFFLPESILVRRHAHG